MFCENCGKQIDNDSAFCVHCGSKTTPLTAPVSNQNVKNEAPNNASISPFAIVQLVLSLALAISPFLSLLSTKKIKNIDFSLLDMNDVLELVGNISEDAVTYSNIMKVCMYIGWGVLLISLITLIFGKSQKSFWGASALSNFAFMVVYGVAYYLFEEIKSVTFFEFIGVSELFYIFAAISVMGLVLAVAMKIRSK